MSPLDAYHNSIRNCKTKIKCPVCRKILLGKDWPKHKCAKAKKGSCLGCFGKFKYKWGEKEKALYHLHPCFLNFIKQNTFTKTKSCCKVCLNAYMQQPSNLNRQLMGRKKLGCSRFYEKVCETIHSWLEFSDSEMNNNDFDVSLVLNNKIQFNRPCLNEAFIWMKRFCVFREKYRWYHIMVRACAFSKFSEMISKYSDEVCILPFWCLCDGKSYNSNDDEYIHHRHCILVTRFSGNQFEKNIWRHVTNVKPTSSNIESVADDSTSQNKSKNNKFKSKVRIFNMNHFKNVLCYVSSPNSKCRGTVDKNSPNQHSYKHHYYINIYISKHTSYILSLLFPSGYDKFVIQSLGPRRKGLYKLVVKGKNGKYYISPMNACSTITNCPIPIAKNFQLAPPDQDIPLDKAETMDKSQLPKHYLIVGNKIIPLQQNDTLLELTPHEWIEYQIKHGNSFMERVEEDLVLLGRQHQIFLNELEAELAENNKDFQKQLKEKDKQLKENNKQLKENNKQLKDKDKQLKENNKVFRKQLEVKDKQLEEKDKQIAILLESVFTTKCKKRKFK